jgi:hypothetical protein
MGLKVDTIQNPSSATVNMTLDTSGNVGIGTSSPGAKFDVTDSIQIKYTGSSQYGAAPLILKNNVSTANQQQVRLFNQVTDAGNTYSAFNIAQFNSSGAYVQGLASYQMNGDYWTFSTANSERMRIDSSGNLLVGTTSANGKMSVTGTNVAIYATQSTAVGYTTVFNALNNSGTYYLAAYQANGTTVGSITSNGTTTAYNVSSDYRLKENVLPLTSGLTTISALKPVKYDWKIDGSHGEGFVAHELQEVIPLAVTGDKDAVNQDGSIKPQGVDYSKIVVHLVAAIQELSAKNDALEARIAALESK